MQGFWINQMSQSSPTSFVTKVIIMMVEERLGGWGGSRVIFINIWVNKNNLCKHRDTDKETARGTPRGEKESVGWIETIGLTIYTLLCIKCLPWWLTWYRICLQCRKHKFDSQIGEIPWSITWQTTPVFLPGESHGQRDLVSYSLWGIKSQTQLSN